MCGRFTHRLTWEQVHGPYHLTDPRPPELDLKPRYNAAPTDLLPVCRLNRGGQREIAMLRWGLIPFWANDPKVGFKSINARAETEATAPAFRDAFKRHRCLVPASGFYEWRKLEGGGKQPYLIQMRDAAPFSFAGLWDRLSKGPVPIESFAIVTGEPNSLVADLHDRMPVILDSADYETWLTGSDALPRSTAIRRVAAFPVGIEGLVNDTPDVIEPRGRNAIERKPVLIPPEPHCLVLNCTPAQSALVDATTSVANRPPRDTAAQAQGNRLPRTAW
jgi:putative SOS response-associated peptidase YedK